MNLYLLRHAESPSSMQGDKARVLSDHGKQQAETLGKIMAERQLVPDKVLCSPATRTRQTLEGLSKNLGDLPASFMDKIYYGSPGELFEMVQEVDGVVQNLLIIGHNPSIFELARILTSLHGPQDKIEQLQMGYAPCTLTALDCKAGSWSELQPSENILIDFIVP